MIVLASSSQTRAAILTAFHIPFCQKSVDFDEEQIHETNPTEFVYKAATGKMQRAEELYSLDTPLLSADTVVYAQGEILRKPKNVDDAQRILRMQSGNTTAIITCTLYRSHCVSLIDMSQTVYQFALFDTKKLDAYIESGEWMGKAGGCMVEGFCKEYIRSVTGYESCAMGLCIEKVIPFINE